MTQNLAKRKSPSDRSENVSSVGETDIQQDTFSFLWTITNYSSVSHLDRVESPVFYGSSKTKHGWQLILHPKKSVEGVDYVSLTLCLANHGDGKSWWRQLWSPVKAKFRFSILKRDGQAGYTKGSTVAREFTVSDTWGWTEFIPCYRLEPQNLIVDNKLKIRCEVEILGELKQSVCNSGLGECSPSDEERKKRCKFAALDDFGKIFNESIATDVAISTGKTSFKAHKTILAARSPVFAAMFNSNMIEKETATVEIKDFEDEVVKGMLEHLYTGQTDCMQERAPELMQIADKYELVGLKEDCQYEIADNLDKDNAAVILVLAHSHNAPFLKQRTMDFINLNKEELLKLKSFQDAVKAHSDTGVFVDLYLSQL